MGNEGKFVAIVNPEDEEKALVALKKTEQGKNASLIGYLREEKGIALLTRLGGRRVIGPLYGEGLPRIC